MEKKLPSLGNKKNSQLIVDDYGTTAEQAYNDHVKGLEKWRKEQHKIAYKNYKRNKELEKLCKKRKKRRDKRRKKIAKRKGNNV